MKSKKFRGGLKRRLENAEFEVHTGVRYKRPKKSKKKQKVSKPTIWGKITDWLNKPVIKGL